MAYTQILVCKSADRRSWKKNLAGFGWLGLLSLKANKRLSVHALSGTDGWVGEQGTFGAMNPRGDASAYTIGEDTYSLNLSVFEC